MFLNENLKAVLAALVPLVLAVGRYLETGLFSADEIALAFLAVVSAVVVAAIPNRAAGILAYLKAINAALVAVLVAVVQALFTNNWGGSEWTTLLTGLVAALLLAAARSGYVPQENRSDLSVSGARMRGR